MAAKFTKEVFQLAAIALGINPSFHPISERFHRGNFALGSLLQKSGNFSYGDRPHPLPAKNHHLKYPRSRKDTPPETPPTATPSHPSPVALPEDTPTSTIAIFADPKTIHYFALPISVRMLEQIE
jgi:hypothetical protein